MDFLLTVPNSVLYLICVCKPQAVKHLKLFMLFYAVCKLCKRVVAGVPPRGVNCCVACPTAAQQTTDAPDIREHPTQSGQAQSPC